MNFYLPYCSTSECQSGERSKALGQKPLLQECRCNGQRWWSQTPSGEFRSKRRLSLRWTKCCQASCTPLVDDDKLQHQSKEIVAVDLNNADILQRKKLTWNGHALWLVFVRQSAWRTIGAISFLCQVLVLGAVDAVEAALFPLKEGLGLSLFARLTAHWHRCIGFVHSKAHLAQVEV